jgi:hypothetical protein
MSRDLEMPSRGIRATDGKRNKTGGTIRLLNPSGVLVHAVSYSKADAIDERYIRFIT